MNRIGIVENNFKITSPEARKAKGFWISPYSLLASMRYLSNLLFNGYFSYVNPDAGKWKLLGKEGCLFEKTNPEIPTSSLKVVFLGDIMVSRSGNSPKLSPDLKNILKSADVIICNVESPVVDSKKATKRGSSLSFEMSSSFLSTIYACNRSAQWVFSIANNHACDISRKSNQDVSGVKNTIDQIRSEIPGAEVIGAEIGAAKSVLTLQKNGGAKIGVVGWTEVMNRDSEHHSKKIVRETDLTDRVVRRIKEDHDLLIGFSHANEEQSYHPLKETRDRWCSLIGKNQFDIIVGHGPHVLQPAEQIGENGAIFHSIGNFCSPSGRSQTKIGAIAEVTLHQHGRKIISTDYKIHILEQRDEQVSTIEDLNQKSQQYPGIINRLKKIWKTLFVPVYPSAFKSWELAKEAPQMGIRLS